MASPTASAYTGSATQPSNIGSVESFLEQGSTVRLPGVDITDPRGTDWWEQEHRYFDRTQPSSNAMWGELSALEEDAGFLPRLAAVSTDWALPALGAGVVGFQIGTAIREMYHVPDQTNSTPAIAGACGAKLFGKGDPITSGSALDSATTIISPLRGALIKFKLSTGSCGGVGVGITIQQGSSICGPGNNLACLVNPTNFEIYTDPNAKASLSTDWSTGVANMPDPGLFASKVAVVEDPTSSECAAFYGPERPQWALDNSWPTIYAPSHGYQTFSGCANPATQFYNQALMAKPDAADGDLVPGKCADVATAGVAGCITAPTTWPLKPTDDATARAQINTACDHHPKTCNALSHMIDGQSAQSSWDQEFGGEAAGTVIMPDCNGLLTNPCVSLVEAAGLDTNVVRLGWAGAEVTKPADAVVETSPIAGATVTRPGTVTITVNPTKENYPLVVPQPLPHETAQQYQARLAELGMTDSQIQFLPNDAIDPAYGPNEVTAVEPAPGTSYDPANPPSGEPSITANPPSAPPLAGGGSCGTPSVRSFDLAPLAVSIGNVFPFGIFGWVGSAMTSWVGDSSAPVWNFHLTSDLVWHVDLSVAEPLMSIVRPCFLILSAFGIVWMLAAAAMKIQGPSEE